MDVEKLVPSIDKYLIKDFHYIEPDENSRYGLCVPKIVFDYGSVWGKLKTVPFMGRYMPGNIIEVKKAYKTMHNNPSNPKNEINDEDLECLKEYTASLGVDKIGFTEVPNSFIFSNKKILYKNVIVLLMEMKKDKISLAPSIRTGREIFRTYYELGYAANKIKVFLNNLGYAAQAGPALGGEVHYPSLAQKAGLGQIGSHGLLITPEFGPSLRIGAVYTNIENLNMTDSNEHAWIQDFCSACGMCINACPVNAIYKDSRQLPSGSREYIDFKKCAVPFSNNNGCTVCIKYCAFFKSDYNRIKSAYKKSSS